MDREIIIVLNLIPPREIPNVGIETLMYATGRGRIIKLVTI